MNPHLLNAKVEFWRVYESVKQSLAREPRHRLLDLQHDAEDVNRQMSVPFSYRAAAQMVHAACTELLGK